MIPTILEITACVIAALFGIVGLVIGVVERDAYIIGISGYLVFVTFAYLSQVSELQQGKGSVVFCKVLNRLIYATMSAQVIVTALRV